MTSSFEEELEAAKTAVQWLCQHSDTYMDSTVTIATDSQSLCRSLLSQDRGLDELWNLMDDLPCKLIYQWIPGHSDVCGNELADTEAKKAASIAGEQRPVSFNAIRSEIKNLVPAEPPKHQRTILVYSCLQKSKEQLVKSRHDQVHIARLRSGHHLGLNETQNRYNPAREARCERCNHEKDNLVHWLSCDGTMAARMRIFGDPEVDPSVLTREPMMCLALARDTFRGAGRPARR